jgi:hypothetical protein
MQNAKSSFTFIAIRNWQSPAQKSKDETGRYIAGHTEALVDFIQLDRVEDLSKKA